MESQPAGQEEEEEDDDEDKSESGTIG